MKARQLKAPPAFAPVELILESEVELILLRFVGHVLRTAQGQRLMRERMEQAGRTDATLPDVMDPKVIEDFGHVIGNALSSRSGITS